jgi:hypothetical protein
MALDPVTAVLSIGSQLIDRLWPNPAERDAAKLALYKAQQEGQFKEQEQIFELAKGQIDVNKIEAASTSFFVAGWRPAVGWTCVAGLGYSFFGLPILSWGSVNFGWVIPPALDMGTLLTLLLGMLGLGGLRTKEKIEGVAR